MQRALRSPMAERSCGCVLSRAGGRMSIVYLARDLRHNRLGAVKILRPRAGWVERFLSSSVISLRSITTSCAVRFGRRGRIPSSEALQRGRVVAAAAPAGRPARIAEAGRIAGRDRGGP